MNITEKALIFATQAHNEIRQVRKYSGAWYIVHPIEVAQIVSLYDDNDITICAAYLHDVVEDVASVNEQLNKKYGVDAIMNTFGYNVATVVKELTDVYTKEAYPLLNRHTRHTLEAERLATVSEFAKNVKCADIIANTSDIAQADPGYAVMYIKEKVKVTKGLVGANPILHGTLTAQLNRYVKELNIRE